MAKAAAKPKAKTAKKKVTKKKATPKTIHVTFLIDRSGSMESIRSDVIGGFNSLLHEQQEQEGDCLLTVHQFDGSGFDTIFRAMDIHEVRDATSNDFKPRGNTPLYDAIGWAITEATVRQEQNKNEQPLFVILTDGHENASKEYRQFQIAELIAAKEKEGWIFSYLGANQDAFAVGGNIAVAAAATQNFVPDSYGTQAVLASTSQAIGSARVRSSKGMRVNSTNLYDGTNKAGEEDFRKRTKK